MAERKRTYSQQFSVEEKYHKLFADLCRRHGCTKADGFRFMLEVMSGFDADELEERFEHWFERDRLGL